MRAPFGGACLKVESRLKTGDQAAALSHLSRGMTWGGSRRLGCALPVLRHDDGVSRAPLIVSVVGIAGAVHYSVKPDPPPVLEPFSLTFNGYELTTADSWAIVTGGDCAGATGTQVMLVPTWNTDDGGQNG